MNLSHYYTYTHANTHICNTHTTYISCKLFAVNYIIIYLQATLFSDWRCLFVVVELSCSTSCRFKRLQDF